MEEDFRQPACSGAVPFGAAANHTRGYVKSKRHLHPDPCPSQLLSPVCIIAQTHSITASRSCGESG